MTQQNCRPCQGIQTLTPIPIRNLPGQRQLHYRAGTYGEFFESMLAALSRGGSRTGSNRLQSVLRYLTAREKDDPSIATLDAWAVLADVLTFYNERYIDEAFLRTAKQASSLHELANLVGYTPRPGLSSSVFLTFEVDERSSEVLIPAGTQAKSTPIPGSGESSETFETNAEFTARSNFNKIRPSLSRPHNLRPSNIANVDRLYFKGTGLRIQPNDFIAIGAREIGEPRFRKVVSSEERRETVRGPATIVTLEPDELAPSELIKEAARAIERFLIDQNVSTLLKSEIVSGSQKDLTEELDNIRREGLPHGILRTEKLIDQRLINERFLAQNNVLRTAICEIFAKLVSSNTSLRATSKAAYNEALHQFCESHEKVLAAINSKAFPDDFEGNSADSILRFEKQMYALESNSGQPKVYHALPLETESTSATPLSAIELESTSAPQDADKFDVEFMVVDTTAPPPQKNKTWGEVKQLIKDAKVQGARFVYFKVSAGKASPTYFTAGVKLLIAPMPVITKIIPESTQFFRAESAPFLIDSSFSFDSDSNDADFTYTITQLENSPEIEFSAVTGTKKQVIDHIRKATIDVGNAQRATVLITIQKEGKDVGYALRTYVVDDKPITLRSLAAIVLSATEHKTEHEAATAKIRDEIIAKLEEASKSETITDLPKAGNASLAVLAEVRNDSFGDTGSISAAENKLFEEMKSIGSTIYRDPIHVYVELKTVKTKAMSLEGIDIPPGLDTYKNLEESYIDVVDTLGPAESLAASVTGAFFEMVNSINDSVNKRREVVVSRLDSSKTEALKAFEGAARLSEINLKDKLTKLFGVPGNIDSLRWRVAQAKIGIDISTTSTARESYKADIEELTKRTSEAIENITTELSELGSTTGQATRVLIKNWTDFLSFLGDAETPVPPPPGNDIGSISDLIIRFNQVLQSQSSLLSFANLLENNSSLWPQVVRALEPSKRTQFLTVFRNYRFSGTPAQGKVGVWILRYQANLFGWNSQGETYSENAPPKIISKRVETPLDYPNPNKLEKDFVRLDGKFTKTLPGTPIGIRTSADSNISGCWADSVVLEPHTAYGISNETTKIGFTSSDAWFGSANPDFKIVRETKVFCDAEPLELAEELLSDRESDFLVTTRASDLQIELDDFAPELTFPSIASLSGVVARPEHFSQIQPDRTNRELIVSSEVVKIIGVRHVPPTLHGGTIRTSILLEEPLSSQYWRNSVEINANVTEATHGETVVETLGNGDARKPFQKFRLSRGPVTRLPAPNATGKIEALEVRVSSTRWEQVAQLVDSKSYDEVYELRGNRNDASTSLQFGNGIHGTRLPTGIENVKAVYRVGLGVSGNVQAGQINQLPSPPFGVKAVSNPTKGDGGANADTIPQTRLRVPALAASMGRLVSRRDFENFALLFSGIDKVSVEDKAGELILYIAGTTPAPLSKDGQLYRNFARALALQGEAASQVKVEAHAGLLLHIRAQVFVESRYDWDSVKSQIESKLIQRFGYAAMRLGEDVLASEVVDVLQSVKEVRYARLQELLGLASKAEQGNLSSTRRSASGSEAGKVYPKIDVFANEVCYIDAQVSSTVQLERLQ